MRSHQRHRFSVMMDLSNDVGWHCRQAGGEGELAMEMWWRAAALESLQAFVVGPLRKADPTEQAHLARSVAAMLRPTLDAVSGHPSLQVH